MLSMDEIQTSLLKIASEFHDYCQKNDLTYVMAYGTLIGAVRHKGFIPWDNDMDFLMPRPDYERLLDLMKKSPVSKDIGYLHWTICDNYQYPIIRLYSRNTKIDVPYVENYPDSGLWIDIFPADGFSSLARAEILHLKILKRLLNAHLYRPQENDSSLKKILRNVIRAIVPNTNNRIIEKLDAIALKHPFGLNDNQCCVASDDPYKVFPISIFTNRTLMPFSTDAFSCKLYGPTDFHSALIVHYGESYMQLPPESERETHEIAAEYRY